MNIVETEVQFSKREVLGIRKLAGKIDLRVITPQAMVRLGETLFRAKLIGPLDLMTLLQPGFNQNYSEVATKMGLRLKKPPALMNAIEFYYQAWQKKLRTPGVSQEQRLLARREYHLMLALQHGLGLSVDKADVQAKPAIVESL